MDIKVTDITPRCYTNEDGAKVFEHLLPLLRQGESVCLSFKGVDVVPSSFVNSAFISLLDYLDFEVIKKQLFFSDTSRQINEIIKSRFAFEVSRRNADK